MFEKFDLDSLRASQPAAIRAEVDSLGEDYLLNVAEDDLVAALATKFQWDAPVLGEPQLASHRETKRERSYSDYGQPRSYTMRLTEIIVHIPYEGDKEFFRIRPPSRHWNTPCANIRSDCLELVIETEKADGEEIRQSIEKFGADVRYHLDQLATAARQHNESLPMLVKSEVQTRKERILTRRGLVASIGLPLRYRDDSSKTYAIPTVRKKPDLRLPPASHQPFAPEPALAEAEYDNILAIMRSMVRVMEASPHAFANMKEEDLRQHFLVQLNGQYQGRATGETFNYEGKTDILIREGERNVFVGECKFWKGPDSLTKTIDQVLGYLHWRDTKAAIAVFNRNKDFTNVLDQIQSTAQAHPQFKRFVRQLSETEWRFIFANRDDPNREIYLTIVAFDIPRTQ